MIHAAANRPRVTIWHVLSHIADNAPISLAEISNTLRISHSDAYNRVAKLILWELVCANRETGRKRMYFLSKKGEQEERKKRQELLTPGRGIR